VTLRDLIGEESTDKGYPSRRGDRRESPAPKDPIHRQARSVSPARDETGQDQRADVPQGRVVMFLLVNHEAVVASGQRGVDPTCNVRRNESASRRGAPPALVGDTAVPVDARSTGRGDQAAEESDASKGAESIRIAKSGHRQGGSFDISTLSRSVGEHGSRTADP
jgi:hypothetical protein